MKRYILLNDHLSFEDHYADAFISVASNNINLSAGGNKTENLNSFRTALFPEQFSSQRAVILDQLHLTCHQERRHNPSTGQQK